MEADINLCSIFPEKPQTRLPTKRIILQMQSRSFKNIMPPISILSAIGVLELNHVEIFLSPLNMIFVGIKRASLDFFLR